MFLALFSLGPLLKQEKKVELLEVFVLFSYFQKKKVDKEFSGGPQTVSCSKVNPFSIRVTPKSNTNNVWFKWIGFNKTQKKKQQNTTVQAEYLWNIQQLLQNLLKVKMARVIFCKMLTFFVLKAKLLCLEKKSSAQKFFQHVNFHGSMYTSQVYAPQIRNPPGFLEKKKDFPGAFPLI